MRSTDNPVNHRHVRTYGEVCWCGYQLSRDAQAKRARERARRWREQRKAGSVA